jgi:predicted phage terminase large subunit-like protein
VNAVHVDHARRILAMPPGIEQTEAVQLFEITCARETQFCAQSPTERQKAFLDLDTREALYGGAAGGGKSSALLMAALRFVDQRDYAALILRRTYPDLSKPGAIMDRAGEWLRQTSARWSDRDKTWTFPSGARLTFGYLQHESDKYQYQGSEFQLVAFDELTQFTETQYAYLFSRLRRAKNSQIPIRMRAGSNPGGIGHEWVKQRFHLYAEPQRRDSLNAEEGRAFVPARLEDNPHVDAVAYGEALSQLDSVTRAQLRSGDWSVNAAGGLFQRHWFPIVEGAPRNAQRVRYWDLAATEARNGSDPDWTVGVLLAADKGRFWIEDVRRIRGTPMTVEALIAQTAQVDGRGVRVVIEQEPGSSGVHTVDHYRRSVLMGYDFHAHRPTGEKVSRMRPLSAAAEAGNLSLVQGPWIAAFLDEAELVPHGSHDDQIDAAAGAHQQLTTARAVMQIRPIAL